MKMIEAKREGDRVWLEGIESTYRATKLMGCIEGCIRFLGGSDTTEWIYGASGHAFFIAASKTPDICDYHFWDPRPVMKLLGNLGFDIDCVWGWADDDDFSQKQTESWEKIRAAIDQGLPCFGFSIVMPPQNQIITGYDATGYYSENDPARVVPWQEVTGLPGDLAMCTVSPGTPSDDRVVVTEALQYVSTLAEQGGECWGLSAYDRWMASLEAGSLKSPEHTAYLVRLWAECRGYAAQFLEEAKSKLSGTGADKPFDDAIERYGKVASAWAQLSEVFPDGKTHLQDLADAGKRDSALSVLTEARQAEKDGLESLLAVIEAL